MINRPASRTSKARSKSGLLSSHKGGTRRSACFYLAALAIAHTWSTGRRRAAGMVHHDVSPPGLFLMQRQLALNCVDFGVSKAAQRFTRTQTGTLKGKLSYMAPEQARRRSARSPRRPVRCGHPHSGKCSAGRRLFSKAATTSKILRRQKSDPVPFAREARPAEEHDRAGLRALRMTSATPTWPRSSARFRRAS